MHHFPENSVKAWAKEYGAEPFYFIQTSEARTRLIAWSGNPEQVKSAFYKLLEHFSFDVEVMLKIMFSLEDKDPMWQKFRAVVNRSKLVDVVHKNEAYVFADGMNQLWIRNQENKEYFAFDDHGIFFVYSSSPVFTELFSSLGFQERYEEPLYARSHFHHRPSHLEYLEMKFVSDLNLEKVASDI
ncbi:hypothetical protein [Pedosphaera parvula]|uniref:Uncharacterized protein n=1 Tax=Pedosphaera parvula (strain Ellin514) TaxID=320771 RepID=B9XQ45_PEDPL|nr:hypothetical protein [Pedosphaera parvula]EEF58049.1 hypothetical protein Cflav_PD1186 [Pedosphaera parvula Ellin514]